MIKRQPPWSSLVLKVLAGSLPMFIPTLTSQCIILKSWDPDAIFNIISGKEINTATAAWSLTDQVDHEHWQKKKKKVPTICYSPRVHRFLVV